MQQTAVLTEIAPARATDKPYYIGLDVVRFLAAVMVGAFHLTFTNPAGSHMVFFGFIGVQIFFVMSGLVIANSANRATGMEFLKHRFLRLYPAAWVCSVLGVVPLIAAHETFRFISHEFAKSFTLFVKGPWLGSAWWTLPVEMAFYALVTVLICAGIFYRLQLAATILTICSFLYLTIIASSWARFGSGGWMDFDYGIGNMLLLRYGVFFCLGIFFWMNQQGLLTRLGRVAFGIAFGGALLEIFCRASEVAGEFVIPIDKTLLMCGVYAVFVLACVGTFLASKHATAPGFLRTRLGRLVRALGLASYPLYLLHEVIGLPVVDLLRLRAGLPMWLAVTIAMVLVLGLSSLVASYFEVRVRRVTKRAVEWLELNCLRQMPAFRVFYRAARPVV